MLQSLYFLGMEIIILSIRFAQAIAVAGVEELSNFNFPGIRGEIVKNLFIRKFLKGNCGYFVYFLSENTIMKVISKFFNDLTYREKATADIAAMTNYKKRVCYIA